MKIQTVSWVGVAIVLEAAICQAAIFHSTANVNQSFTRNISYTSRISNPALNVNSAMTSQTAVTSGLNSISFIADTEADTGYIDEVELKPFGMNESMRNRNVSFSQTVIDVPANFPLPAVTHVEERVYREQINITGFTADQPRVISSTTNPLTPFLGIPPWFRTANELTIDIPSFFIHGTYEAIAPSETRTVPFSVEFQPTTGTSLLQTTAVKGGQNFGNDFEFGLTHLGEVRYQAVNPVIIDEQVGDLHFRASFQDSIFSVQLWKRTTNIPEPTALCMATGFALTQSIVRRRRRRAVRPPAA